MGFFSAEGFPTDLLLMIFVQKFRISGPGVNEIFSSDDHKLSESFKYCDSIDKLKDPNSPCSSPDFVAFTYFAFSRLMFQSEAGAVPGKQKKARARICFNWKDLESYFQTPKKAETLVLHFAGKVREWADHKTFPATSCSAEFGVYQFPDQNGTAKIEHKYDPIPAYTLNNGSYQIEIYTRSTWGIYQLLGSLLRYGSPRLFSADNADQYLLNISQNVSHDCFVSTSYRGANYCVPTTAYRTKILFTLLQELIGLNTTAPTNGQANTQTVRTQ
jgi:hypothetical protein